MNIGNLKDIGTRTFHRSLFMVKKYSPELLTAGAVVGVVGTAILAGRAAVKTQPLRDQIRLDVADLRVSTEITENDIKREVAKRYISGYTDVAKKFIPAGTMAAATVICVLSAHGILKRRNVAMAIAYKTLESTFNEYSERMVEELGEEREREVRHNFTVEDIIDPETGKKVKVKSVSRDLASPYSRMFDESNQNWQGEVDYNDLFLRNAQNYANDMLRIRGHVTLNDVYERLGFERTRDGQLVGWEWGGEGDNFIDFGLDKFEWKKEGVWHIPGEILLDFNVDGFILDKIELRKS